MTKKQNVGIRNITQYGQRRISMPTDENRWKEMMIESGRMPDDKGYWHYNPQAIEDVHKWMLEKESNVR